MTPSIGIFSIFNVLVVPFALAHSILDEPEARQVCAREDGITVILAGGTGVGDDDSARELGGVPGPCGDPWSGINPNEFTFEGYQCSEPLIRATYVEGSTMLTTQDVRGNHGGFFKCEVCDDPADMSEDCFQSNQLISTETNTTRWYILDAGAGVRNMEWQLPEGLTCEHCVLSCQYVTARDCKIACEESECGPVYAAGDNPAQNQGKEFKFCVDGEFPEFGQAPQIFRNCADISITPADSSAMSPGDEAALFLEETEGAPEAVAP